MFGDDDLAPAGDKIEQRRERGFGFVGPDWF
jgi:hypothetical protein